MFPLGPSLTGGESWSVTHRRRAGYQDDVSPVLAEMEFLHRGGEKFVSGVMGVQGYVRYA